MNINFFLSKHIDMEYVYVVNENGEVYPSVYKTYASAVKAVNDKHREYLLELIEEAPEYKEQILGDVNPLENASGKTLLYIEKGIHIEIYKLPIEK
jgi:hypothetical protein